MLLPRPPRRRGPLALSLVAMVDVVMNLLFFFMMAARFPAWRTLPLELGGRAAAPTGAQAALAPPVRLTLLPTGRLAWDGAPTPRGEVENRLAAEPHRPVRVEAVAGVPFQATLALIESLRRVSAAVTLDVPERVVARATGAPPPLPVPTPASVATLPAPDTLGLPTPDSAGGTEPSIADFLPGGPATPARPETSRGAGASAPAGSGGPLPPPPADPGATPARSGYLSGRSPAVTYDPNVADRPAGALPGYDDPYWTREKPLRGGSAGGTAPPDSGN